MKALVKFNLAIFLLGFVLVGCQKRITEVDSDFVGYWEATGPEGEVYHLTIDEEGEGTYEAYEEDQRVEYASGVVRLNDDVMSIGRTELKVQAYPVLVAGQADSKAEERWKMRANFRYFYRD